MKNELDFVHDLEQFTLAHHHSIKFYLDNFHFLTRFAEFQLAHSEARQYRNHKTNRGSVIRYHHRHFGPFLNSAF